MLKYQITQNFGFVKGMASVIQELSTLNMFNKLKVDTEFYKLSDKERLHNDYRKSTLPIKEEIDKFERCAR
ncbi:hypothetical protein [Lactococcus garvieae]|uniref:Uncharacterized protein n=1 Tax=Lactococcus garvieae TaxID=1363 RepID=A0A1I4FIH3_9LACT|nr:hypothetical protein [Lactococcus garvieae]SFL17734.1 hypothetical protein SAMN05216438_1024 [Lactococcus garvieae]